METGWGHGMLPNDGRLIQNLHAEGIQCSEIDRVILSHAHPDHIGGNTDVEGKATFSNARYTICRKEWEYWTSDPDLSQLNVPENMKPDMLIAADKYLTPIEAQFDLIDGDTRIATGIEIIMAPGHTPGHIVTAISSGTEELVCICDLAHHPLEFIRPDLCLPDYDPEQAKAIRDHILSRIAENNTLAFGCHFPFPGLGHIARQDDVWLWKPI
jgi:glyoxylase-like metal-dependent hydrolase (beta-lactamase superfamily II)